MKITNICRAVLGWDAVQSDCTCICLGFVSNRQSAVYL